MEMKMKKIILFSVIIPAIYLYPQVREIESRTYFKQGNFEFNFSTNIGVGFSTTNGIQTYQNYYPYDSSYNKFNFENSDRPFNLLFTASIGYCIIDGLAFEPELDLNLITDAETSISLIGNLTYNFNIPRKNTYPFIKLGYGVSNYSSDYYYYSYQNESNGSSFDTRIINAGAGLKFLYSSGLAMKLEINFKNYSYSTSSTYSDQYYSNTTSVDGDMNVISISLGFSILL
jgi:hypothetical protein